MDYTLRLTTDRPIDIQDAAAIVDALPASFGYGRLGIIRQKWGWVAATEIRLPDGTTWTISGSYIVSGDAAEPMAAALAEGLRARGYTVTIGELT